MNEANPLVSIGVITYNSGQYVKDTLDSIKAQTYQNIELIISDDCSTDNTIDVCKKWLNDNKERFTDVQIINSSCNTGISANNNRAIKASHGEWFKVIAGDDILMPDCIVNNMKYISQKSDTCILFSQMIAFRINQKGLVEESPFLPGSESLASKFTSMTVREQYIALLCDDPVAITNAPTLFARRELLLNYPFNEFYKYSDDVPQWIKLTKMGVHLDCMNVVTVKYRRGDSLSSSNKAFYSPLLWGSKRLHFWNELESYLKEEKLYDSYNKKRKQLLKIELLEITTKNRPTLINKVVAVLIGKILNFVNYSKF